MIYTDKTHIGSLNSNKGRPTFTAQQLVEIYEAAGRSVDAAVLRAKAAERYPGITEDGVPPLWVAQGSARAFAMEDGSYVKPKWRLGSNYCRDVGILPDGTPLIY